MLGVLVWIVVILLICFSVTGWHWIIFYVVILPFSTWLFFFYVDFPENRFNINRSPSRGLGDVYKRQIMCFTSYSQNKQISYSSVNGLVTYDNGSGTKADIGAKLYIIPCKYFKQDIELKNDSIQMGYEFLLQYIKWKELVGQEQAIAKLKEYDFYISAEEQIRREGELAICLVDILKSNKVKYSCTIDNTGKYKTTIPYGNYYFIFKSANKSVDKSILNGRGTYNIYKIKLYSKYKDISTSFNADYH